MYCGACGYELKTEVSVCPVCGCYTGFDAAPEQEEVSPRKRGISLSEQPTRLIRPEEKQRTRPIGNPVPGTWKPATVERPSYGTWNPAAGGRPAPGTRNPAAGEDPAAQKYVQWSEPKTPDGKLVDPMKSLAPKKSMSLGLKIAIGLLILAAVGLGVYFAIHALTGAENDVDRSTESVSMVDSIYT